MTLVDTVLRYLNLQRDQREFQVVSFDASNEHNHYESSYPLVLESDFKGTIVCSGDIHIRKNASFSGELMCRTCKIEGSFKGSLISTEHTAVCNTAHLDANIVAASIFIESNAVVTGNFNITRNIQQPPSIKRLEFSYSKSIAAADDHQLSDVQKTVILRGILPQSTAGLPAPLMATALPQDETPGGSSASKEAGEKGMNRSEQPIIPPQNVGWW